MASGYSAKLINDLPDQFKGKPRIEAFMCAVGKQLDDLKRFYDDLNTMRTLSTAEGTQLDMIGSIVGLTRLEACDLISSDSTVMDDETYRALLGYKIMLNTSSATYYDIVRGIRYYYNIYSLNYSEDPSKPAHISLTFPDEDIDAADPVVKSIAKIKPAGVSLSYRSVYNTEFDSSTVEAISLSLLEMTMTFSFWQAFYLNGRWLLDGSVRLDGNYSLNTMPVVEFTTPIEFGDIESIDVSMSTSTVWYFDGTYTFDGTKSFNGVSETSEEEEI